MNSDQLKELLSNIEHIWSEVPGEKRTPENIEKYASVVSTIGRLIGDFEDKPVAQCDESVPQSDISSDEKEQWVYCSNINSKPNVFDPCGVLLDHTVYEGGDMYMVKTEKGWYHYKYITLII